MWTKRKFWKHSSESLPSLFIQLLWTIGGKQRSRRMKKCRKKFHLPMGFYVVSCRRICLISFCISFEQVDKQYYGNLFFHPSVFPFLHTFVGRVDGQVGSCMSLLDVVTRTFSSFRTIGLKKNSCLISYAKLMPWGRMYAEFHLHGLMLNIIQHVSVKIVAADFYGEVKWRNWVVC